MADFNIQYRANGKDVSSGVGSLTGSFGTSLDSLINHAQDVIFEKYGDTVSVDENKKDLFKFGENPNVGTSRSTIWYTGQDQANETYVATNTNSIDSISSSIPLDTLVTLTIEGHTESDGNKTFVTQTVVLNGQTRVELSTPLNRCTRIYNATSTATIGEVYVYENTIIRDGKPSDTTKIHCTLPEGENQSLKASTSLSSTEYWIITGISCGYKEKSGSNFADVRLEIRQNGFLFRPAAAPLIIKTGDESFRNFNPYIIAPKNSDIRLTAVCSSSGQDIIGDIQGYLAKIVS